MKAKNFRELIVWQKSIELAKEVYRITNLLPDHERFGLISQLRRSVISVPSNIAEGQRRGTKEFLHFLSIADGSLAEVETQLILVGEIYFSLKDQLSISFQLVDEIQRMIFVLSSRL